MINDFDGTGRIHLILVVDEDDTILFNTPGNEWYHILSNFNYLDYFYIGVAYYDALYDYNIKNDTNCLVENISTESKEEAKQRLLENRPTVDKSQPVLYQQNYLVPQSKVTSPFSISPGIVPDRFAGRKPKCFFSLFKSFIGVSLMGRRATPDEVYQTLISNPAFARVCGFNPCCKSQNHFDSVPSHRKIQQFDMIMERYGIWSTAKYTEVAANIKNGIIEMEDPVVGDTTHYHAYSNFEVVKGKDETGKKISKSQSKVTKNCRCENQQECEHEYVLTDDGAGTIVKSGNQMHYGHKASVVGFPIQDIPLDVRAVSDAATNDGETFFPHIQDIFLNIPLIKPHIKKALYDSACYRDDVKTQFKEEFGIELKASINPRQKQTIEKELPRGMNKLTPYGELICNEGREMEYQGYD